MQWRRFRVPAVALGCTIAVGALLAAPVGATPRPKSTDTVTCSLSAGTTFTWSTGTVQIDYSFYRSDSTLTEQGFFKTHGSAATISTPADAASVQVLFVKKDGTAGKTPLLPCSA